MNRYYMMITYGYNNKIGKTISTYYSGDNLAQVKADIQYDYLVDSDYDYVRSIVLSTM